MVVGEFTRETDLVVLGGGPAGYAAAFRAAEVGQSVIVVDEHGALGGTCLHAGCVPSKTLLHIAETVAAARGIERMGVHFERPAVDVAAIGAWIDGVVARLAKGLAGTAQRHGVEIVRGRGRFEDPKHVVVRGADVPHVKFRRAIIATGSTPRVHPALPFDGVRILRPNDAVRLSTVPETALVIGSGYMAVEHAMVLTALGSTVTLLAPDPRLLPEADEDLVRPLARRLKEICAAVHLGVDVAEATVTGKGVEIRLTEGALPVTPRYDQVIVALGQVGVTGDIGLDAIKLATDADGFIAVDDRMQTGIARIFAAGDVTGPPLLADRALAQGRVAAEVAAGWGSALDARAIPMVVFTDPQVAWCGLTEQRAQAEGIEVAVTRLPWGASGRAVGMGRPEGVTKLLYDPHTKIILGAAMTGPSAAEMIAEGCLAVEMGAELDDLAGTIHPHPTASELLSDAARVASDAESSNAED